MNTIINILLLLCLVFVLYQIGSKIFYHYHRKIKYTRIIQQIHTLYRDTNAFAIAKQAALQQDFNNEERTYGEIDLCTLLDLLARVAPKPNDVLYDLGSGDGKSVLAAKLCYPNLQVKGIEFVRPLHDIAIAKKALLQKHVQMSGQNFDVNLICDNILNQSFNDGNILFINATAFTPMTWEQILDKLLTLQPGTKVIVTTKTLPSSSFKKVYQGMELMSWGLTSTYIYEKTIRE